MNWKYGRKDYNNVRKNNGCPQGDSKHNIGLYTKKRDGTKFQNFRGVKLLNIVYIVLVTCIKTRVRRETDKRNINVISVNSLWFWYSKILKFYHMNTRGANIRGFVIKSFGHFRHLHLANTHYSIVPNTLSKLER